MIVRLYGPENDRDAAASRRCCSPSTTMSSTGRGLHFSEGEQTVMLFFPRDDTLPGPYDRSRARQGHEERA